jgi:hypothetical protein
MKKLLIFSSIIFSTSMLAQSEIDTIIINNYQEYPFIYGAGKGKTMILLGMKLQMIQFII